DSMRPVPVISASLSPNAPGVLIPQLLVEIDAAAATPLTRAPAGPSELEVFRWDLSNLVHHLRADANVLVVGVGGGRDILSALAFDQRSVTGVEVNRDVVDLLLGRFGPFTGHIDREPRVTIVRDEARTFLTRTPSRYDIIQIS